MAASSQGTVTTARRPWAGLLVAVAAMFVAACSSSRTTSAAPAEHPDDGDVRRIAGELLQSDDLARKRILAFGETTHGTREFRALFFETALAAAAGGQEITVALEWEPFLGSRANEWAEGCGHAGLGSNEPLHRWLTAVFSETELDFLERMRQHGTEGRGCIRVIGVDAPVAAHSAFMLRHFGALCLSDAWSPDVDARVIELDGLEPVFGTDDPGPQAVLDEIEAHAATARGGTHCEELDWWLHLMRQHVQISRESVKGWPVPEFVNTVDRDRLIADNVAFWAKRGHRVLLLAHAGHVAKTAIPSVHGGGWSTPAGVHLEASFPDDYRTVAMLFGEGSLFAIGCAIQGKGTRRRIPAPRRASLQRDLLPDLESPTLLSAEEACRGRECQVVRSHVYCLPRGWNDARVSYSTMDVAEGFDWVVFFPRGTALGRARGER